MTRHDRNAFRCDIETLWRLFSTTSRMVRRLEIIDCEARSPEETEFTGTRIRARLVSALGHARRIMASEENRTPSPRRVARVLKCLLRLHNATGQLIESYYDRHDCDWWYCHDAMMQARYRLKAHGINYRR